MKVLRVLLVLSLLGSLVTLGFAQTKDLGMGAFENESGQIRLAVDAALADEMINSPYVMFILYMAAPDEHHQIVINRDSIVMIYKGQEYKMPSVSELRKNYQGEIHDVDLYRHLGKEGIASTWIRLYQFPPRSDFFPPLTMRAPVPVDEATLQGFIGFRTKVYFKNPGFKKGDTLTIKVTAKNDPSVSGQVDVVLK
ncbi:MAG: hypothetical protein ACPLZD_00060 [Candidatus Saccharicenans sp.]|nr:MAG: hypothetical protein C0168_10860 [Candidatus Aminicenantes bacterium]HEK85800.1 hypothetical protein [Candidatus Aminicenantes bacterium]